jgi:class 3 adenylate cyclase
MLAGGQSEEAASLDIAGWLQDLGLAQYVQTFRENEVDLEVVGDLTEADLETLGIPLGHRKKLLRAIARLAEPGLAPPSVTGPARAEAERRQVTVLFCDLVGSTELSGRLDPEDMRQVIRTYQDACSAVITRFEGHVAKYMGDGVLAYFGYPRAHEDDAERAVRTALALRDAVGRLPAPMDEPLAIRAGIATGLVVIGDLIGEGSAQEQAIVGETPNLAARLQALAAPGDVLISRATRRLVGGLFGLTDLGPVRLKGFREPLAVFKVDGEASTEGRFEALRGGRLTPLVGREHELGILLERWARAKEGEGQIVLLTGEPGIGKSRLIRALREQLSDEPHVVLSHFCSPYHTNSALYPVIRQLERAAGLRPDDAQDARLARLEALLGRATNQLDEAVPLLAALLGIPTDGRYMPVDLTPQRQKQRTCEVLIEQLVTGRPRMSG